MSNEKKKQRLIYLITVLVSIAFVFLGNLICRPVASKEDDELNYKAQVVEITDIEKETYSLDEAEEIMATIKHINFKVEVKSGPYKGDIVEVSQNIDDQNAEQMREVFENDKILISRPDYEIEEGDAEWMYVQHEDDDSYYKARVIEITGSEEDTYSLDGGGTMVTNKRITFKAEVKNGPYKGDVVEVSQDVDNLYAYQPRDVRAGDNILISRPNYVIEEGDAEWIFIEHNRIGKIITLIVVFLLLIILIGRLKGVSTILSLIFTVLSIFLVYIPSILKGYNVYVMTVIVSIFTIFMSLIIINGWNKKTLCAIVGNSLGVATAGIIAAIVSRSLEITGMVDEDYIILTMLDTPIDLRAIVWGGVVIGALGAIMDVAMSIASAMNELNDEMRDKTFGRMLRSGMNIGRDAIGTMTNTLILAYIGGALATVLLLVAYNKNIYFLFNMEMIMAEIISAIVGSIGILAAVPATALFSAYIFNRDKKEEQE